MKDLDNPGRIGFWRTIRLMCTARGLEDPAQNFDFKPLMRVVYRLEETPTPANDNTELSRKDDRP